MRLFLLVAFLALVASVFAGDTSTCRSGQQNGRNNFDIVQAINNFCGPTWDLTVPSYKAYNGANSNNNKIKVNINAVGCNVRKWIPRKYCISQFYNVCAKSVRGGRGGKGVGNWGPNGCQRFIISGFG